MDGRKVAIYAGLVAASGAPAQREAIVSAYKAIHDLGVVHRSVHPRNWHFGHGVVIGEWGRAHVRRRGFGFHREMDGVGIEWVENEIEFERMRTAETKRVNKFFAEKPW
ncbi:hypothetical protein CspHIS471_0102920 [Cutaneotrichosporon sp. HIS471]|nr:hypothetical protein CspHIS471_0102920 [Cutaneotrichosporon sp. HIS471]